jgi:hypothetical protein
MIPTILHISQDEKFIESAKHQFNKLYGKQNQYYILVKNETDPLRYVKEDVQTHKIEADNLVSLLDNLSLGSVLIFHNLPTATYSLIDKAHGNYTLIWIFFGMEVYNDHYFYSQKKLFSNYTKKIAPLKSTKTKKILKHKLRPYFRYIQSNLPLGPQEHKKKIMEKFEYIGLLYREDFDNIKRIVKLKKPKHLHFSYYPIEKIVNTKTPIHQPKDIILIGNSGHPTSNHFDVLKRMDRFKLMSKNVVLPISYGNAPYIKNLKRYIEDYFATPPTYLEEFLAIEEYNKWLERVSIFILYTKRQQGVGNTIALLYHGAKVFLSKHNTFYHYLKRIGVLVFCYETQCNAKELSEGLTPEQILHNRKILYQVLNEQHLLQSLAQQLQPLLGKAKQY